MKLSKATLTSKGQLTIPRQVRDHFDLRPGDKLAFEIEGESVRLSVEKRKTVDELFALFPGADIPFESKEAERAAVSQTVVREDEKTRE